MLNSYIAAAQGAKKELASAEPKPEPIADDDLAYIRAQEDGSITAYERYLDAFPNGKFKAEANTKLDSLYFRNATRARTIEANQAYLARFPDGRYADLVRQRLDYLPLMNACLKAELETIDQLLASGKSLAGYAEPAQMLMRLLQKQTTKTIRMSEFNVTGMKGPSKTDQLFDLGVFMKLLDAGADPNAFRIKGFEKAGRKNLGGAAYLYSTGDPGEIVPAREGGMSALEFAEANDLTNFKKLLLIDVKDDSQIPSSKKVSAAKRDLGKPQETQSKPAQENAGRVISIGQLSFLLPDGLDPVSNTEAGAMKSQIASSEKEKARMYQRDTKNMQASTRIESFQAFQLPNKGGWVISYIRRMEPQKDYLSVLENDQKKKIEWGKRKGMITKVFAEGRAHINGGDIVEVDNEMRDGHRVIGLYHWSPTDPGAVAQISILIKPGLYDLHAKKIVALIDSLRIRE
jgi:hypothetical protein